MIQDSGFCKAVILGIKNCFDFKGRASRAEYWYWHLFIIILDQFIDSLSGTSTWIFSLISFIPGLSVSVRRLHDVNYRGWWWLPIVNIWAVVVCFFAGNIESNRFGLPPNPIKITLFDKVFVAVVIVLLLTLMVLNFLIHTGQVS